MMFPLSPSLSPDELIGQIADRESDLGQQNDLLVKHPDLRTREMILRVADAVSKMAREDIVRASRLSNTASWLADVLDDDFCRARALRARGNLLSVSGKNADALNAFQAAIVIFDRLTEEVEIGITLSSSLQPLIYLSKYVEAFDKAQRAREIFEKHGDRLRLARLDANLGNILHRQDRFREAVEHYGRALKILEELGQKRDRAPVLGNAAVCYISLNDFERALDCYKESRAISEEFKMTLLVAQADYNIAYLYYFRGEHTKAIELYQATRLYCEHVGDAYHSALCDLDQSELYLELFLSQEGEELAKRAFAQFEEISMGYEAAKALVFLGVGEYQRHKPFQSLDLFVKAQQRFRTEENRPWVALIQLYRCLVLYQEGLFNEARRVCDPALTYFSSSGARSKTVLANLLSGSLYLEAGRQDDARRCCNTALELASQLGSPALLSKAYSVEGRIHESDGDGERAIASYRKALAENESIASRLAAEELKIPFVKDGMALYESLVSLHAGSGREDTYFSAYEVIEKAKSHQLAELIALRSQTLPAPAGGKSDMAEKVKALREELSWYYRQVDFTELRESENVAEQTRAMRHEILQREDKLLKTLDDLKATDEEFHSLQSTSIAPLDEVRGLLADDQLFLQFFQARGTIYVSAIGRDTLQMLPVTRTALVRNLLQSLHGQSMKLGLGREYQRKFGASLMDDARITLGKLYEELIEPVADWIDGKRLIISPDGPLHYLPFHALFDGSQYLSERHSISYAGSATLYCLSSTRKTIPENRALVMVAPNSEVFCSGGRIDRIANIGCAVEVISGPDATSAELAGRGPGSRFIHLATHLEVRRDSPLFSTLTLGSTELSVLDVYSLRLPTPLIGLSGTGPGIRAAGNGGEILAFSRGLEYAGGQAILLPLWNAEPEPTEHFLAAFYGEVMRGSNHAEAFQQALKDVRQEHPHPYQWASYTLRGWTGRN